ncbi:MAG: hypothetical protein K8S98_18260 [Planctomycetes bacterium]|nr:hypothetical protein [Planctomycetota bacterium]
MGTSSTSPLRTSFAFALLALASVNPSASTKFGGPPLVRSQRSSLLALSDDFEGAQIASAWLYDNPSLAQFAQGGGALSITPTASGLTSIWFDDSEGPLIYKQVTGDFTVRATLHARDTVAPNAPPPQPYRLGGLLVRNPNGSSGDLDWVHVAIGGGDASVPIAVEDKTTVDSSSDFVLHPLLTADAEVRIRRRGVDFELHWRPIGTTTWTALRVHHRPDLPATVDVGLMAYSASTPPRLRLACDEIVFAP